MLDKTSFKFIMGFLGILAISFVIFIGIGYYRVRSVGDAAVEQQDTP